MKSELDAAYRLKLSAGFLGEAEDDFKISRWRSCVDNAQMTVENAAKAIIAFRGPVPKVHKLHRALSSLAKNPRLAVVKGEIAALAEITNKLGFEEHIRTDYGDESQYKTPWEIFDRESAEEALNFARNAQGIAKKIVEQWLREKEK